uniref:tRNA nucleotidyltransferase/poly(A) polymerase n=1 Tax=Paulinella longichromatophora TaxID=1708747 RepID=A0A2H4ZPJ9_9EUKA|nr:tRNA nucleotidyltransferase/poly(A) polymerase [Paulinella longichromatophora]
MSQGLIGELEIAATNTRLALVGGVVRDWLLHRIHKEPWVGPNDLDLVVEFSVESHLNARELAKKLISLHPNEITFCHYYDSYGTVEISFLGGTIDLATARKESYPKPGNNPIVRFSTLESDLARRDLRLNAIAMVVKAGCWKLLDPYGGQQDLANGWLEFLHNKSVADDPTRLIRAARYGARLVMTLGQGSITQVETTIREWPWSLQSDIPSSQIPSALTTRLRMELELLLECQGWRSALYLLQTWGALRLLDHDLQANHYLNRLLVWAKRLELPLLIALVSAASDPLKLASRLQLPKHQIHWLQQLEELKELLATIKNENSLNHTASLSWLPSRWCRELETRGWAPQVIALGLISGLQPRQPLLRWWCRWRHMKSPITADEILIKEIPIGNRVGNYLRQLRWHSIDIQKY